jgi:murein DD-endopeptidase MepM/ murein hydrolase activator NlpD
VKASLSHRINGALERYLPERRLFLKSDHDMRYIRLKPGMQLIAWVGSASVVAWTIIATAILLMDSIGSSNLREQAKREQIVFEARLNALSEERDHRAEEAKQAQERFNAALEQVSAMQTALLSAQGRQRELSTGIEVVQKTLRRTMNERDEARIQSELLTAELEGRTGSRKTKEGRLEDVAGTVSFLTAALDKTAQERDQSVAEREQAIGDLDRVTLDMKLAEERNDRIFGKLEEAVTVSLEPLDKMFRAAGLPTDQILKEVRRGYSGQGGPLTPISMSTKGEFDPDTLRANSILAEMDRMNLYRIAAEKAPFDMPVKNAFRYTSGFGPRWGRAHNGTDFAAPKGTPVYATADGTVVFAGISTGFGKLVRIQHAFGIQTYYAHNSKLRVKVGQKVSRGDHISDMGNTGRSTGNHLHYEIRVGGKPVNPMTYIKAAKNVF